MEELRPLLAWLGVRPFARRRPHQRRRGNARLVALSGLTLLVLLPVPYVSALSLDLLWRVHFFSSLVLVPLLLVKFAGTGWRAVRYYLRDADYRADGPPHPMARLSAPILVLSTIILFVSGVVMMLDGDRFGVWSTVHNGAAIIFTGALGLHLLAHLWDTPLRPARPATVQGVMRFPERVGGWRSPWQPSSWASPSRRSRCRAHSGRCHDGGAHHREG